MANKILKSLQSEGGFSVAEATIIDENRNIIDAHTIKVLDNTNNKTFKKEYIVHGSLTNSITSLQMIPGHVIETNRIVFVTGFMLGTWLGYPVATYNVGANSTLVTCTLQNHGLQNNNLISVEFGSTYSSFNGNYNITRINNNTFTFNTSSPLDASLPVLQQSLEVTSYGDNWEYATKIESAILSDDTNFLSLAAISNTIVKDNVPPGHVWNIVPVVNNTTKIITFTPSVSTTSDIEMRGNGIRWSGKIEIVYTERNY
jgi:hypothetical protein